MSRNEYEPHWIYNEGPFGRRDAPFYYSVLELYFDSRERAEKARRSLIRLGGFACLGLAIYAGVVLGGLLFRPNVAPYFFASLAAILFVSSLSLMHQILQAAMNPVPEFPRYRILRKVPFLMKVQRLHDDEL
jgi:hypothetical protein